MTTERRLLLLGTVDADGRVNPTPVVAQVAADGTATAHEELGACEPHSTVAVRALLAFDNGVWRVRPL